MNRKNEREQKRKTKERDKKEKNHEKVKEEEKRHEGIKEERKQKVIEEQLLCGFSKLLSKAITSDGSSLLTRWPKFVILINIYKYRRGRIKMVR